MLWKIGPEAVTSRPPKGRTPIRAQPGSSHETVPPPPPGVRANESAEDEAGERVDPSVLAD